MKTKPIITTIILLALSALTLKYTTQAPLLGLEINFLDVGQGDAILIRNSGGKTILIDGGPDGLVLEKIGRILPYTDRTIDVLILTHPHADHLVGLLAILESYRVETVIYTGVNYNDPGYRYFQEIIKQKVPHIVLAETPIELDLNDDCRLNTLFPLVSLAGQDFKKINNSSIVTRLNCGNKNILLMGDAEKEVETELMDNYPNLKTSVLKLGHHGSKTASSQEFLDETSPGLAVILVGKDNKYNLPSPEVIDELQELNLKVIRTDQDGGLKMWLTKTSLSYQKSQF